MKKIFISLFIFIPMQVLGGTTHQTENSCSEDQGGGWFEKIDDRLVLHSPESDEEFIINTNSEDYKLLGPSNYLINDDPDEYFHIVTGDTARLIFIGLLNYFKKNSPDSCRLKDFEGGIVYAKGIACRHGRVLMRGHKFMCTFYTFEIEKGETVSGGFALPRPRMGAGNADAILRNLNKK